ncbi:hypothetical protein HBI04_122030 [Parastagonospora nodorum]|nr:hypothetical protein HBH49_150390 [Parastagonospora nodorum]KAH4103879.1 hypothetical protein HBH46_103610 [Parastagonospora nodorum]KAH4266253.1 hypothetical protein HBI03_074850 [Parastagonospora nodorum]KAH4275477.1 hypothetical protein HBI04_122030 [Parastagonospora nodorum]KAH4377322.1 hypothetical protein HBH97_107590 [Parastagonospora nodorum]
MRTAARSAAHASPAARARSTLVFFDPACANATSWLEPGQHAVARRRPWIPDRIILPFYHPTNIPTETENSGVLTDALRVLPGPLFLYLASTSCQGIHMLRDQTGLLPSNYSIATSIRASFVACG